MFTIKLARFMPASYLLELPKYGAMYVLICSCQATFTGLDMPVSFYKELFFRFGSGRAGQLVVDLSPKRSKIGEAAFS